MTQPLRPTALYKELNARFFRGRLPRFLVTLSAMAPSHHGSCYEKRRLISLNRHLESDPELFRRTLLHEMCHIGIPDHGQRFQRRLLKLATLGESWAREEAEDYRLRCPSWSAEMANLRGKLDEYAALSPRPRPRFPSLVRFLASDLGLKSPDLLRRAPWLRPAWTRACNEHDRFERKRKEGLTRVTSRISHLHVVDEL